MKRMLLALLATLTLVSQVAAQDIVGKAKQAEALAHQGKYAEALAVMNEATAILWDKSPLFFRRALWVAEPPQGFGAFNPRENNVFKAGTPMIIYAEPVGFGWRKAGDIWRTQMEADLVVKTKAGEVLLRRTGFQTLQVASRVRNREFMVHLTYRFTGFPKGAYVAETTLRDTVTGKKGTFALPFVIQ